MALSNNPVGRSQPNIHRANTNMSRLLGMVRNRATQSDNISLCRECLSQNNNNPQEALDTLKTAFRMAGAGSPSESLKSLLYREATNLATKNSTRTTHTEAAPSHQNVGDSLMRATLLGASPELVPEDKSYQAISKLRDQHRQTYQWQKTPLPDGRKVMILGGLERDVKIFNTLFEETQQSHLTSLDKMHKELLNEVTKELYMLVENVDLETDAFASQEVKVIILPPVKN